MIPGNNYFLLVVSLCAVLLMQQATPCKAQKKYEREYTIKSSAVPETALKFINSVFGKGKVHWYGEESLTGKSIEAKLKFSGNKYSVEFDPSGKVQDIEVLIRFSDIPREIREVINENLTKEFRKHKITKVQRQWIGSEKALEQAIKSAEEAPKVVTNYELVLQGNKGGITSYFEVLYSSRGELVRVNELVQRNTNNLIY